MFTNNKQIGLQAESRGEQYFPPKSLSNSSIFALFSQKDLLINIRNCNSLNQIDKVNNMLDEKGNVCYGCIYLIENIQNHKKYIGYTTQEYEKYIQEHFINAINFRDISEDSKKGKYFYNAIRKYGIHNFKWRVLGYCYSFEELKQSEIECIYFYRSFGSDGEHEDNTYGYNRAKGGNSGPGREKGCICSYKGKTYEEIMGEDKAKERKQKQSEASKGKQKSEELKQHLSDLYIGKTYEEIHGVEKANKIKKNLSIALKKAYKEGTKKSLTKNKTYEEAYGEKKSKEIKQKQSASLKGKTLGIKRSKETRKKLSESHKNIKLSESAKQKLRDQGESRQLKEYQKIMIYLNCYGIQKNTISILVIELKMKRCKIRFILNKFEPILYDKIKKINKGANLSGKV